MIRVACSSSRRHNSFADDDPEIFSFLILATGLLASGPPEQAFDRLQAFHRRATVIERAVRGYGVLRAGPALVSRLRDPGARICPRACGGCRHDFLIAYSCKGRGVYPSCNTRRMAETAAHLVDHAFPQVPVRQWVLSLPKHLRYFLHHDPVIGPVLRIILRGPIQGLKSWRTRERRFGAVTFVHRFGSAFTR